MARDNIRYFIFDLESVADGRLVANIRYPGSDYAPAEAVARYREELMEERGSDFIPYTFHLPISLVVGKVTADFRLVDLTALDEPEFRPHIITEHFWRGWEGYRHPTLVTFNGRGFDVPVLELAAFRYGLNLRTWMGGEGKGSQSPRQRYNASSHLDLMELLTNFGATRFNGGLNLACNLLGKPGKTDVEGYMVQDMFDDGRLAEINDYCRRDVLDTYFVFLRSRVLTGQLALDEEQRIVSETKQWLEARAGDVPAFQAYLEAWQDWENPWE
ncbi:MAG: 3'-5' exonuclease [Planctomycetales bacterium]|nr:3'-5' exonuclease [Planctomycetales bacterium]